MPSPLILGKLWYLTPKLFPRVGLIMTLWNSWVQTDLGNRGAEAFSFEKAAIPIEDSAAGLVKVIDASTLETHSGKLFKFDGDEEPW